MSENEKPNHWVIDDVQLIGKEVGGLKAPTAMTALVIDGYATEDGKNFDHAPFGAGRQDGTIMLLSKEVADNVYDRLSAYLKHPRGIEANVSEENEAAVARWDLPDGRVAVLVLDTVTPLLQEKFNNHLSVSHNISVVRSPDSSTVMRFDAERILRNKEDIMSGTDLEMFLEDNKYQAPRPAPKPTQSSFSFKP